MFWRSRPAMPAIAGEPYYPGYRLPAGAETCPISPRAAPSGTTCTIARRCTGTSSRAGLAATSRGPTASGRRTSNRRRESRCGTRSAGNRGAQMKHLRTFAFSNGTSFQDLEPDANLVTPNKTYQTGSYEGWAFCARTPQRDFFLVYFEKGLPQQVTCAARFRIHSTRRVVQSPEWGMDKRRLRHPDGKHRGQDQSPAEAFG